jgi:hypothetical protein
VPPDINVTLSHDSDIPFPITQTHPGEQLRQCQCCFLFPVSWNARKPVNSVSRAESNASGVALRYGVLKQVCNFRVRRHPPEICSRCQWSLPISHNRQGGVLDLMPRNFSGRCIFFALDFVPKLSNIWRQEVLTQVLYNWYTILYIENVATHLCRNACCHGLGK